MECMERLGHLRPFEVYYGVGTLPATIRRVRRSWDTACDQMECTRCSSTMDKQPDGSVAAVPATTEPLMHITRVVHISDFDLSKNWKNPNFPEMGVVFYGANTVQIIQFVTKMMRFGLTNHTICPK